MSSHNGIEHRVILTSLNSNRQYINGNDDETFFCRVISEQESNTFYISDIRFCGVIETFVDNRRGKSVVTRLEFSLDTEIVMHPGEIVYLTDDFTLQIVKYIPQSIFKTYEHITSRMH